MKMKLCHMCLLFVFFADVTLIGVRAQAQEAVAVITEIKLNRGDVQIRFPGKKAWEKPGLLQSVYAGTQIQAFKDATAVVLFTEGTKTVTVNERNSPFEVKADETKGVQRGGGVKEVANMLMGKKKPATYVALAVRGGKHPPVVVSPRNTKLMTDSPTLQWMGMERQPGTVKLYGPEGLQWSAENIALTQIKYPSSAPRLKAGVEYSWVIEKKGFPPEKAPFKLLTPEEAQTVKEKMASLNAPEGLSKTTVSILKSTLLVSQELFHEAREILMEAVNADPDEPTLHFLLGEVYEKTGLKNLAMDEYSEAEFLAKKRP
jgi:hypothetical protein